MPELVYILTNPTIPDLVKIGQTTNLEDRMRTLSSHAGVPVPFECYYCCEVANATEVERRLLAGFGDHRINPKREFLRINPERIKVILEGWAIRDVTPREDIVDSPAERDSLNRARARRPVFTFSMVDIPIGSEITWASDETKVATVTGDREIDFEGNRSSLNQITLELLRQEGKIWPSVRGPDHWMFENETLTERRLRLEDSTE